jgi:hypothetical protein
MAAARYRRADRRAAGGNGFGAAARDRDLAGGGAERVERVAVLDRQVMGDAAGGSEGVGNAADPHLLKAARADLGAAVAAPRKPRSPARRSTPAD